MVSSSVLNEATPRLDSLGVPATAAPVDAAVRTWQHWCNSIDSGPAKSAHTSPADPLSCWPPLPLPPLCFVCLSFLRFPPLPLRVDLPWCCVCQNLHLAGPNLHFDPKRQLWSNWHVPLPAPWFLQVLPNLHGPLPPLPFIVSQPVCSWRCCSRFFSANPLVSTSLALVFHTPSPPSPTASIGHRGSLLRQPSSLPGWLWMVYSVRIDALHFCRSLHALSPVVSFSFRPQLQVFATPLST